MPKEIVTLSFGSYASFVSAHYWNLQDEAAGYSSREEWSDYAACINHDVLFYETESARTALYRPRTVFFDVASSTGGVSFSADGASTLQRVAASGASAAASTWRGGVEVHRSNPVARSAFRSVLDEHEELDWEELGEEEAAQQQAALETAARQLDGGGGGIPGEHARGLAGGSGGGGGGGGARYWTDFCKVLLHPRSVYCVSVGGGGWGGPESHGLAGGWGAAAELLGAGGGGGAAVVEEGVERVRYLAEGCDSLAGFQILVDDTTGFGALSAAVLTDVAEEFHGRPLLLFGLRQTDRQTVSAAHSSTARISADLSPALAVANLSPLAHMYVPLAVPYSMPHLSYNLASIFHTSAVLAAAVDTALLPTRLTGSRSPLGESLGSSDLHSLTAMLRPGGSDSSPLTALHAALPCPALAADVRQLAEDMDERVRHDRNAPPPPHARGGGLNAAAAADRERRGMHGDCTAQLSLDGDLVSLTPGISGRAEGVLACAGAGCSRAESYCLRGGRTQAGPVSTAAALSALDALLLRQPNRMCVRHRCTAPMPMAVPLPYPDIFAPSVSVHGDVMGVAVSAPRGHQQRQQLGAASAGCVVGGGRVGGQSVYSVPVLTRWHWTREFEGWVRGLGEQWKRAGRDVAAGAVLSAWGMGRGECAEVEERLAEMAASFTEEEDV